MHVHDLLYGSALEGHVDVYDIYIYAVMYGVESFLILHLVFKAFVEIQKLVYCVTVSIFTIRV